MAKFAADRQNEEEERRQASGQGQPGPLGAEQNLIDWIIENGGEILVDLFIGGIKACAKDPNLVNCLMGSRRSSTVAGR